MNAAVKQSHVFVMCYLGYLKKKMKKSAASSKAKPAGSCIVLYYLIGNARIWGRPW